MHDPPAAAGPVPDPEPPASVSQLVDPPPVAPSAAPPSAGTKSAATEPAEPLRSEFAGDEDFAVILDPYLAGLPAKRAAVSAAAAELPANREPLQALAHQIKGAAGGYGFPQVTEAAAALLAACREGTDDAVRAEYDRLASLMSRMSA